jgi:hypothetical protein
VALFSTLRWVLGHLVRDPLIWLWGAVVMGAWPLIAALTPVGLTTANRAPAAALYDVAFMALLVGNLAGARVVARGAWFLAPLPPGRRIAVELVGLSAGAGAFLTAGLLGAALVGAPLEGQLLTGCGLAHLHLAAVGLLLLRAPLGHVGRMLALPMVAWLLPALLAGTGAPGPALARVFAAQAHLGTFTSTQVLAEDPGWAHRGAVLLPILGLLLAAVQLSRPDALRRSG